MIKIKHIKAREILASGGSPSLEVEVILDSGVKGEASVSVDTDRYLGVEPADKDGER